MNTNRISRHERQHFCEHSRAEERSREQERKCDPETTREYAVVHLHCNECGMFFSREDWSTLRIFRHGIA